MSDRAGRQESLGRPYADLLLVDGDPLTNIEPLEDATKTFVVIMKDGAVFKNIVH